MEDQIVKFWWCKIWNWHKWTSAVQQNIKPTREQLSSEYGFWDYAKMYCERCGHISELSKKELCKSKNT